MQIRCIVVQPVDWIYPPAALAVIRQHWKLVQYWMELKSNRRLNFEQSVFFLIAPWTYQEMALQASTPPGFIHAKVINWMASDPGLLPELNPRGLQAAQSGDTWSILVPGGGSFAGAIHKDGSFTNVSFGMVGEGGAGPILGANGHPELNRCGVFFLPGAWQCEYDTTFGAIIHELSHAAFRLDHPEPPSNNVMNEHWSVDVQDFSKSGFIPRHIAQIQASPYVLGPLPDPGPGPGPAPERGGMGALLFIGALALVGFIVVRGGR